MLPMRWCCWCADAAAVLIMLMRWYCWCRWCGWCPDPADALMLLMRWCCWCADAAEVLMLLMRWCADAMLLLMCWCSWCTDAADALMLLNQDQDLLADLSKAICSSFSLTIHNVFRNLTCSCAMHEIIQSGVSLTFRYCSCPFWHEAWLAFGKRSRIPFGKHVFAKMGSFWLCACRRTSYLPYR